MKKLLFFIIVFVCLKPFCFGQNTITTEDLTQTSFCAGGNIIVEYTSTGTFPLGCSFIAQLSDRWGNFDNPVTVGTMPFNTGIIAGTIPSNTTFGVNYRVRVVATNPYTVGSVCSMPLVITNTAISATIVANPSDEGCEGDTLTLWATYNESYYWSSGETTQTIHVTHSGTYTVTVKNFITGCEVTSNPVTITVHPTPNVNLGQIYERCDGQSVLLDAGPGFTSYLWNDNSAGQYKTIDTSGIYYVRVFDNFNCTGGDTVQVIFHPKPEVDLGKDTSLCGNSLLLSSGTGYNSYDWNNGLSFNPTYLVTVSGIYSVTVLDSNGCSGIDTISVIIDTLPVVNLGNDISACGSSLTLNGGAGYTAYNWNDGSSNCQLFTVTESGNYFVKVTTLSGCSDMDTIAVILHPTYEINLGPDISLLQNSSMVLFAGSGYVSYQWNTGQTTDSIIINGHDYPLGPTEFDVSVIDNNGCVNSGHITITIVSASAFEDFVIMPNPVHGDLTIVSEKILADSKPVFYDMLGKEYKPDFILNNSSMLIKRENMKAGCYVLFLNYNDQPRLIGKVIFY